MGDFWRTFAGAYDPAAMQTRQNRAQLKAGDLFARKDYQGASGALARGGDLVNAQAAQNYGQAQAEEERKRHATLLLQATKAIRGVGQANPGVDPMAAFDSAAPILSQLGSPDEVKSLRDAFATDPRGTLAAAEALAGRELKIIEGRNGGYSVVDPGTGQRVGGYAPATPPALHHFGPTDNVYMEPGQPQTYEGVAAPNGAESAPQAPAPAAAPQFQPPPGQPPTATPAAPEGPITTNPTPVASQDVTALARMIYAEAGSEGPQGMAAAGHVALNRLKAGYGGAHSLTDVVTAPHQFEGMTSPRANVSPDDPIFRQAMQIAQGIVSGQIPDPTGGAINFLNPQLQAQLGRKQPAWAPGNGQRIGRHVFYGGHNGGGGGSYQVAANGPTPPPPPADSGFQAPPGWQMIQRGAPKPQYRPATPQEIEAAGLPPGTAAQVDPNGKIDVFPATATGGTRGKLAPQDSKFLNEARTALSQGRQMSVMADRFVALNRQVDTGPNPVQRAAAMLDPRYQEMKSISDNLVPAMRNGLPGAASDRDVAMFRSATVGVEKYGPVNSSIATALKAAVQRQAAYVAFLENYAKTNGNLLGAQEEWDAYAAANPMFDQNRSGALKVLPQQGWREYFGVSGGPQGAAPSGPKPGEVQDGYRFKGGDPASPSSWVKVKQ